MFWYIWYSVIIISTVALMILSHKRKYKYFTPAACLYISFMILFFSSFLMLASINDINPALTDNCSLIETFSLEQLSKDTTNEYVSVDNGKYTFKAIVTNEQGIEETEVFTTKHYFTRFIFDSSIAPSDSFVQVYKPTTSFWYLEWLNFDGRHNFYVITLPSEDMIEFKFAELPASN